MLEVLTVVLMGLTAYAYLVEGMFTACVMCVNVVIAGVVAFNFWEPLANALEPAMGGYGYEDFLCLLMLFGLTLGGLRTVTNLLCPSEVEYPPQLLRPGGAVFGLLTGYLVAGILACMFQTLPWHQQFMGFDYKADNTQSIRRFLPPDRLWMAMLHRVGEGALTRAGPTFDEHGSFELRYARHRRYTETADPVRHRGEFDPSRYVPSTTAPAATTPAGR
jgi:hypothetical protein